MRIRVAAALGKRVCELGNVRCRRTKARLSPLMGEVGDERHNGCYLLINAVKRGDTRGMSL